MSSKRCRIEVRSGDLLSAVDGVSCDDEASVAKKTRTGDQNLSAVVLVCLKWQESAIHFTPSTSRLRTDSRPISGERSIDEIRDSQCRSMVEIVTCRNIRSGGPEFGR